MIETFADLLLQARLQPTPQRLLLVFVVAELPDDASAEQRADFAAGVGGALVPLMCVDKDAAALASFAALQAEAAQAGGDWKFVFVAAASLHQPLPEGDPQIDALLHGMVESIRRGDLGNYLAFDKHGIAVQLAAA